MFKKQMVPLKVRGKAGQRVVHKGKGSTMQNTPDNGLQTMTQGDPADRMQNQYAKQEAPPASPSAPSPTGPDSGAYLGVG